MSFPALTTALLISTAPVNPQGGPDAVPVLVQPAAATEQYAAVAAPADAPLEPPAAVAPAESTEAAPSAEAAPSTEPTSEPSLGEEDIVVVGHHREPTPGDPFEQLNAQTFEVIQSVDKALIGPVAMAYKETLPSPIRRAVRNFLGNLGEPVVFLAFVLELKPGKAAETLGRFVINSTLGLAGIIDIAKREPFYLPYRSNGFANVLGYYGVKQGPYMFLPLVGSTTLRDFIGNRLDQLVLPMAIGKPFNDPRYVIPSTVLNELDDRSQFDEQLRKIRAEVDPYAAARDYYLQKRQAEIDALHGRTPAKPLPEPDQQDPPAEPSPAEAN